LLTFYIISEIVYTMNIEEFKQKLKRHDWYFNYSDDHRYYSAGRASWDELMFILKNNEGNPEFREAFDDACPWSDKNKKS